MRLSIAVISMLLIAAALAPATARADDVQEAVTRLLERGSGSMVIVEFDLKRIDGRGGQEVKLQGALVSKDGLVLVSGAKQVDPPVGGNVGKPDEIKVRFPGDVKRDARFVGKDEELNLALLQIEPSEDERAAFPVAGFDPGAEIRPGEQLVVLKRLSLADDDQVTFTLLRVTTVIPRPGLPTEYRVMGSLNGFEGCPVFGLDTRLVGYISAGTRTRGRGRGFRIVGGRRAPPGGGGGGGSGRPPPLLHARVVREFLSDPTKFARRDCWLGVKDLQALTKPLAEACGIEKPGGLVVGGVSEGSPAERAGVKAGDVIIAMDGVAIETMKDRDIASFTKKVRRGKAGSQHDLTVLRRGEEGFAEAVVTVTFQEGPITENEVSEHNDKIFGLKLKPLTRDFLEKSRLPIDSKGVRVTSVEPAGWGYLAGIRAGDVIQKMVLKPCENLKQYLEITKDLLKTRDSEVCYNVTRERKSLFLCVRPDWDSVETPDK